VTVLLVVLAVVVVGLKVGSFLPDFCVGHYGAPLADGSSRGWMVACMNGRICLQCRKYSPMSYIPPEGYYVRTYGPAWPMWPWDGDWELSHLYLLGFYASHNWMAWNGLDDYLLAIPDWFVIGLFLLIPMRRWKKRLLVQQGRCVQCGYDLRATPDRCPECGGIPQNRSVISN
jgi:hypothetical protein